MSKRKNGKKGELYCKEKNLLQLPIFYFGKTNKKEIEISWEDENHTCKVTCFTNRDLPGSLEMDIYSACLRIWVRRGMPLEGIEIENSDIAKTLGLSYESWHTKIKKSILKLGAARYEFVDCFVDAKSRQVTSIKQFSLFGDSEVKETDSRGRKVNIYKLVFPKEVQTNLEEGYYQWLDFRLYRKIKSGLARRLYEFLEKRRYHNIDNTFSISEEKIFRWLPLTNKNVRQRRATLKSAIAALIEANYLDFGDRNKRTKLWSFTYARKISKRKNKKQDSGSLNPIETKNKQLDILFSEAKKLTESLKKFLEICYSERGFDYVLWNVRYTNANAKKSYITYLRKALTENWAEDWKEEQLEQAVQQNLLKKEEAKKYQNEMKEKLKLEAEQATFKDEHKKIPLKTRESFWRRADLATDKKVIGRGMHVKIEYIKLVVEELAKKEILFSEKSISPIKFINEVVQDRSI